MPTLEIDVVQQAEAGMEGAVAPEAPKEQEPEEDRAQFMSAVRLATVVIDAGRHWIEDSGNAEKKLRDYKDAIIELRDSVFHVRQGSAGVVAKLNYIDEKSEKASWSGTWKEFLKKFFQLSPRHIRRILNEPQFAKPKPKPDHEKPLWKAGYEAGIERARVDAEEEAAVAVKAKVATSKAKSQSKDDEGSDEEKILLHIPPSFAKTPIALGKEVKQSLDQYQKRYRIAGGKFVVSWLPDGKHE